MQNSVNYLFRNTSKINGYPTFDIEQENLIYSDMLSNHGCQCKHQDKKHDIILDLCHGLVNILRQIELYNNWTNEEVKDLFAKTYKLNFINWIDPEIADFKFYVFSLDQMIKSLSFLYDFEKVIEQFIHNICPKCQSDNIYENYVKEYKECQSCDYRWY